MQTLVGRFRLGTLLLLMAVVALFLGLLVGRRHEAQLQSTLALYRDPTSEGIYDALDEPLGLVYPDEAPLEDVLKQIKLRSTGRPKLPTGIPIYVDPIGLQEAEKSMTSTVKRPPNAGKLTLGEHLHAILNPMGLDYLANDGFLMITSKQSLDVPTGDQVDLYLQYRDVLQ